MRRTNKHIAAISLSGFFTALSIVIQRFLVIPFGMPSLYRLSLGNVPIIIASLFLGPFYGGVVGASADLIGALLFPVGTFLPWPLISSTLYGVLPWLLLRLVKTFNQRFKFPLLYPFLFIMVGVPFIYIFTHDSIRHPFNRLEPPIEFTPSFKVGFIITFLALVIGLILVFYFIEKRYGKIVEEKYTGYPQQLAFAIFLMGIFVDVIYGSWWKMHAFGADFLVSVFFHTIIMFTLLPFQTSLVAILSNAYAKSNIARVIDAKPLTNDEEVENKD